MIGGFEVAGCEVLVHVSRWHFALLHLRLPRELFRMARRTKKIQSMILTVLVASRRNVRAFRASSSLLVRPIVRDHRWQHALASSALTRSKLLRTKTFSSLAVSDLSVVDDIEGVAPPLFQVHSKFEPTGDQPYAIEQLSQQLQDGQKFNVLKGATGTGKTFVMSHIIARHGKPTLVLVHNKTLAAQLARELRSFFPTHAVELFISAFKTYRPEFYKETTGTYCAKKSTTDADIEALRHIATRSLVTRKDVVVVASVSCIFGLGLPSDYLEASTHLKVNQVLDHEFIDDLERMLYQDVKDEHDKFARGSYEWRETMDDSGRKEFIYTCWPPQEGFPMRVELQQVGAKTFKVTALYQGDNSGMEPVRELTIFPARHYVVPDHKLQEAMSRIEEELRERVDELMLDEKVDQRETAARLQKRTWNDLMMMQERGFCKGMENYSRHLAGRAAGEPPGTLMDYMGKEWLLIVDESHVTVPQLQTMYRGDQSRKDALIKHGYRLPSARDNRPLTDREFWSGVNQTIFVSATPSKRELLLSETPPVEMQIRPTYVRDPAIHVRSPEGQLDDLLNEIRSRALVNERTLAMVLTKKDAEDLASYLEENDVKTTYIHSGLGTQERSSALKALQTGEIDCLVGVNLLREGLDIPQCSLVAVFNADADGMFRSQTSLLQIIGRAARNTSGTAIFYAKRVTENMRKCIEETATRRARQLAYVEANDVQMVSSVGSSIQSPFDLLRDKIDEELASGDQTIAGSRTLLGSGSPSGPNLSEKHTAISVSDKSNLETDHIPNFPGIYYWKDPGGQILYIGKAKSLRSRILSYLTSSANRSHRINTMLGKASSIEFEITPSERDALVLESKLIKHHQPPYNVLLKDDHHYPYICARVGDKLPAFTAASYKQETNQSRRHYRYFGPYTSYQEINSILQAIEEKYDLRAHSFLARHGGGSQDEYNALFQRALQEIFVDGLDEDLQQRRSEYEEASHLFESPLNTCRDVVVAVPLGDDDQSAVVQVVQLRKGMVARRFSYTCQLPSGFVSHEDFGDVIHDVLEKLHYRSGQESPEGFSFFPDEILLSHSLADMAALQSAIDMARKDLEPLRKKRVVIKTPASRGERKVIDARAIEFAMSNAQQSARDVQRKLKGGVADFTLDKSAEELATMLSLEDIPRVIECYDVSHTQGDFPVASRVVFVDGKPAPQYYRTFNIRSVVGVDDYASIQEAVYRRFRRFWTCAGNDEKVDASWDVPDLIIIDGGVGQLSAAIKGMAQANVLPGNATHVQFATSAAPHYATVPIAALAKEHEQLYVPGEKLFVNQSPDSPAMLLLRSLRDESHRFALKGHRRRRSITKAYRL
ncbi:hypothetical protein MPSEU_000776200 [Mayamaea pseudoterrestris]|nr:hypothetical protein MPSEU_000776200 [Mayamaea pseudoterrestris]